MSSPSAATPNTAPCSGAVTSPTKTVTLLGHCARAGGVLTAQGEPPRRQPALLEAFAPADLLGGLAGLGQPGAGLEHPGPVAHLDGAGAELLDQHDHVADRVVGQDDHGRRARNSSRCSTGLQPPANSRWRSRTTSNEKKPR